MSVERLSGKQMDAYERVWVRVMLASGTTLLTALFGVYVFLSGGTGLLVCGIVAAASLVVTLIAATKLRERELGSNDSDRESRGDLHSALDGLDDN